MPKDLNPARAQLARAIVGAIDFLAARRVRVPADLVAFKLATVQTFAAPKPAAKPLAAVNAYQADLQAAYDAWADDLADELADAPEDDRDDVIAAAVAALLLLLKRKGADKIPQLAAAGFGGTGPASDKARELAARNVAENESYLTDSLGPDLKKRAGGLFDDPAILAAIASGAGAAAIAGILKGETARVGSYAGQAWKAYNEGVGAAAQARGKRVYWKLEAGADHCEDCLEFGDKEYDSYEAMLEETGGISPASGTICQANCRCMIQEID